MGFVARVNFLVSCADDDDMRLVNIVDILHGAAFSDTKYNV